MRGRRAEVVVATVMAGLGVGVGGGRGGGGRGGGLKGVGVGVGWGEGGGRTAPYIFSAVKTQAPHTQFSQRLDRISPCILSDINN